MTAPRDPSVAAGTAHPEPADPRSVSGEPIVHEYDGILEADNQLPRWWLGTLFGTIVFAALYFEAYTAFKSAPSPLEAYEQEVAEAASAEARRLAAAPVTGDLLLSMSKQATPVEIGKTTFSAVCTPCHGAGGIGVVGPNLTDAYWLHGGKPQDLYQVVKNGVTQKGMPAWGPQLGEEKVRALVAYVLTLRNTNAPGGKAPQGELVTD